MELKEALRNIEIFHGLTDEELESVAAVCRERRLEQGETIAVQGQPGDDLFIITQGFVEILLEEPNRVVVNLGPGQITGEMALLDQGPRSATVRAVDQPTVVQVINRRTFEEICQQNAHLGYVVIRNIAADLIFKLRHRNLSERYGVEHGSL